jgi:3-hydroxyacyl-CoA dehydrogenase
MSTPGTDTAVYQAAGDDGIAVVTLDHFPMNSLSRAVMNRCAEAIIAIEQDPKCKGVVVHGAGRCFCAGADISQFGVKTEDPVVIPREVTDMLGFEGLSVPVVAAIHGYALGGGLEAALGCHYRVIDAAASVGLPEVNLGLLPGGQGTQRLPRLVGCEAALQLMTSGAQVPAAQALEWGVVDEMVPAGSDLVAAAKALCKAKMGLPLKKIYEMPSPSLEGVDLAKWHQTMAKARPGEIAPGTPQHSTR